MEKKSKASVVTTDTSKKTAKSAKAKPTIGLVTEDGRLKTLESVQAEAAEAAEANAAQPELAMAPRLTGTVVQVLPVTDLEERRQAAAAKMNNATKATSAHAYALVGCDGHTNEERIDAMRAKLSQWNEGIRRQACKLAMSSKAQPGSTTASLLKQLHDEQPAVSAPTAAQKSGGGGGRAKRDANEAREIKVTEADGRAILSRLRLSDLFTGCKSIRVEVTPEGMMITPVR